jgi:hypothetical protein
MRSASESGNRAARLPEGRKFPKAAETPCSGEERGVGGDGDGTERWVRQNNLSTRANGNKFDSGSYSQVSYSASCVHSNVTGSVRMSFGRVVAGAQNAEFLHTDLHTT